MFLWLNLWKYQNHLLHCAISLDISLHIVGDSNMKMELQGPEVSSGSNDAINRHGCLDPLLPRAHQASTRIFPVWFVCKWLWVLFVLSIYHKSFCLHYLPYCNKCLVVLWLTSIHSALISRSCCCLWNAIVYIATVRAVCSPLMVTLFHAHLIPYTMLSHQWCLHGEHLSHCEPIPK